MENGPSQKAHSEVYEDCRSFYQIILKRGSKCSSEPRDWWSEPLLNARKSQRRGLQIASALWLAMQIAIRTQLFNLEPPCRFLFGTQVWNGNSHDKSHALTSRTVSFLQGVNTKASLVEMFLSDNLGSRGPKVTLNCFGKLFESPSGHGRLRRISWMSTPESRFSCCNCDEEQLLGPCCTSRREGRWSGMSAGNSDRNVYVQAVCPSLRFRRENQQT